MIVSCLLLNFHLLVWPRIEGIDPLDDVLGRPQGDVLGLIPDDQLHVQTK